MRRVLFGLLLVAGVVHASTAAAADCESLAAVTLPDTRITSATIVPAGTFTAPQATTPYTNLPEFCRVTATLTPSADSDIRIEVWLPDPLRWNGKFLAVGNGGWAGSIAYGGLAGAVTQGYAGASTDTGHTGNTASFALGHPEKVTDLAYRAVHEMTVQAKALTDAYYGEPLKLSMWSGCSFGGRQGITAAQRYPTDFDAVIAGAPAVNWMNLHVGRAALNLAANKTPIPPSKYPVIHEAVLQACDGTDGLRDGIIENPLACRFDPKVLQCKGEDAPSCLTTGQVESARAMYRDVKDPKTGAVITPGLEPGTELNWGVLGGPRPHYNPLEGLKYLIHQDAAWDFHTFDLEKELELASKVEPALSSSSTDLHAFFNRGGKLLLYHGFADPQVPDRNTIDFFNRLAQGSGKGLVGTQLQLYMVPGMEHCQGGPGVSGFDKVAAMEQWIAGGSAPAHIVGVHVADGKVVRSRPICPFGQIAKWNGIGSSDEAANFSCVADTTSTSTR